MTANTIHETQSQTCVATDGSRNVARGRKITPISGGDRSGLVT